MYVHFVGWVVTLGSEGVYSRRLQRCLPVVYAEDPRPAQLKARTNLTYSTVLTLTR